MNDDTPYHKFYEKINENENKELFEKFKKLIDDENKKAELKQKCKRYSQLIMFELTHIYQIWYKQEPSFTKLDKELKKELKKDHDQSKMY